MTDVKVVSVVRDSEMYDKCVKNNPHFCNCELIEQENRAKVYLFEKIPLLTSKMTIKLKNKIVLKGKRCR